MKRRFLRHLPSWYLRRRARRALNSLALVYLAQEHRLDIAAWAARTARSL
jgi:hypothetical protein